MKSRSRSRTISNHRRRKYIYFSLLLLCGLLFKTAEAQNWFKLQGTEPKKDKVIRIWGFIQPAYFYSENESEPQHDYKKNSFLLHRARIGVRGVIPGTDGKVNYFVLTEWGRNGITMDPNGSQSNFAALTDASITLNYIPGARIRVGQFKLPVGIDGLKAIQIHEFVEFADVFDQLMLERYGLNRSVNAFRDIGIEVFDWWKFGNQSQWEISYALMLSNGNGINIHDNNSEKDFTGKLVFARIFDKSSGSRRHNLKLGFWYQTGERSGYTFDSAGPSNGMQVKRSRIRYGTDFTFSKKIANAGLFRLGAEYVIGNGWIYAPKYFDGAVPLGRRYFTLNTSVEGHGVPHADTKAQGWYVALGYRPPGLEKVLEINARYGRYDPDTDNVTGRDLSQDSWSFSTQVFFSPAMRVTAGYSIRNSEWNAALGNQVFVQFTGIFKE